VEKIIKHDSWPIQPDILNPPSNLNLKTIYKAPVSGAESEALIATTDIQEAVVAGLATS